MAVHLWPWVVVVVGEFIISLWVLRISFFLSVLPPSQAGKQKTKAKQNKNKTKKGGKAIKE